MKKIPYGKVATYGQIAFYVEKCTARMAGYAMARVPEDSEIPWYRVINSQGKVSPRSSGDGEEVQLKLLKAEGVSFSLSGKTSLANFQWKGPKRNKKI